MDTNLAPESKKIRKKKHRKKKKKVAVAPQENDNLNCNMICELENTAAVIYGMSNVLPIDGYCISRLFTYEACAPHLFAQDELYVGDEHVFLGYLPKMSYVLSIGWSFISWLFTHDEAYVCDDLCVP
ncbi:hypothetical protein TSUD_171080 [Trifolium subterraneum]|uniref:Uncharacterized protein n=1 Tax=Trifolium subterraneum TaxID=3900 RepID=A0A2Z6LNW1_TRISU|nr:hypothetical protein TSUD_171080 [Trifolium subterraneum]